MKVTEFFLLFLVFSFTEQTTAHRDVCPPWFFPDNSSNTGCSCTSSGVFVMCRSNFSFLHLGFCMTYNSTTDTTEYGPCPYLAHYNGITEVGGMYYTQLPKNVSLLNEFICGPLNREGPLCAKCKDGYGIALYSYTLECSKCWGHGYGWALYYFLELFPITVMYFLVVIFHIRATSSPLSALVFMSHILVYTIRLNVSLHIYIENVVTGLPHVVLKVLLVLCGIWSLDFFRSVVPPFCVSSNIRTVHALALEYLVAFYPIFLIFVTYLCIKLHDNNFRPVVWLWKPFHRHFVYFRRRWDSRASIINAFTTFLLLSFSKILFVSFTLLYYFHVKYNRPAPHKCVLYYDPTVECIALERAIFAAIAGCVLLLFIIFPTIFLILYPTRLFRRCVSCCGFRRWHAVHMFVESFQGQYKDGTNGTHDFRMVSASLLILRILTMGIFVASIFSFHNQAPWISAELQCILFLAASVFYAVMKPYKSNLSNNIDYLILILLEILSMELVKSSYKVNTVVFMHFFLVTTLPLCVPHVVLIFYICYVVATKAGITHCMKRKYTKLKECVQAERHTGQAEACIDFLPDRIINPGEYQLAQSATEEHTAPEPMKNQEPVSQEPRRLTPVYTYGSIN